MEGRVDIPEGVPLDPTPELPDDTPIDRIVLSMRIRMALTAAGLETIGEIRETPNEILLKLQDLGPNSVSYLREALGLPSCDGVRSLEKTAR